jgi:hypothetical protein
MEWKIVVASALIAGTSAEAFAQGSAPAQPTPAQPDGAAAARATRDQQEGYNRIINQGVPVTNADDQKLVKKKERDTPVAATAADLAVGAAVRDKDGVQIATVERLEADGAVVRSQDRLAKLPVNAFGKDDAGLLIGITAAEFQAAIAKTSVAVPQEQPQLVDATAADMTPGATIRDSEGVPIGTVDALAEDGVIILTDGKKVKLAVESFAKDENGLLIGITASEFKAIVGNSGPARTEG